MSVTIPLVVSDDLRAAVTVQFAQPANTGDAMPSIDKLPARRSY